MYYLSFVLLGRHHAPVVSREDYDEHNRGGYHAYGRGGGGGGREGGGALSRHTNRARGQVAERYVKYKCRQWLTHL